jgi:hypothetical protein
LQPGWFGLARSLVWYGLEIGWAVTLQASQSWSAFLSSTVSSFWVFTSSFSRLRAYINQKNKGWQQEKVPRIEK